jgi:hypothetical protein
MTRTGDHVPVRSVGTILVTLIACAVGGCGDTQVAEGTEAHRRESLGEAAAPLAAKALGGRRPVTVTEDESLPGPAPGVEAEPRTLELFLHDLATGRSVGESEAVVQVGDESFVAGRPDAGPFRCWLPAERTGLATIRVPGFLPAGVPIPPDGDRWEVPLDPGPRIEGFVRSREGEPLCGVDVFTDLGPEGSRWTSTDEAGRYRLGGLVEGERFEVVAQAAHLRQAQTRWAYASSVRPGRLDFEVETWGALRAVWRFDRARVPLESIRVELHSPTGARSKLKVTEQEISMGLVEAVWGAVGLDGGKHRLVVAVAGWPEREWRVDVSTQTTTTVDVTLPGGHVRVLTSEDVDRETSRAVLRARREDAPPRSDPDPTEVIGSFDSGIWKKPRGWYFHAAVAGSYRMHERRNGVELPPRDVDVHAGHDTILGEEP